MQWMGRTADSARGRHPYNTRLGTAGPPFALIGSTLRLDRLTLRGKMKVNAQWLMYCMADNVGKLNRYAESE
ncbi:MAG: hypothetical protein GKR94_00610 [Gammaproteobacteria bacterium]|nr:hypothetical protein [Gammaproteobacteria bacterium]